MYKCEKCAVVVPPHTHELRRVVATRVKQYPYREGANPRMKRASRCAACDVSVTSHRGLDHPFRAPADDPGGSGVETAITLRLCPACYAATAPMPG